MVQDIEKLPAKLQQKRLLRPGEKPGLFHQRSVDVRKRGTGERVPSQISIRERFIGLQGRRIEELTYTAPARDGIRIAHQVGPIGLPRVGGIAVHRNVKRPARRGRQDTAETPASQKGIQNGMKTRAE